MLAERRAASAAGASPPPLFPVEIGAPPRSAVSDQPAQEARKEWPHEMSAGIVRAWVNVTLHGGQVGWVVVLKGQFGERLLRSAVTGSIIVGADWKLLS